jgi:hypothetical protein
MGVHWMNITRFNRHSQQIDIVYYYFFNDKKKIKQHYHFFLREKRMYTVPLFMKIWVYNNSKQMKILL